MSSYAASGKERAVRNSIQLLQELTKDFHRSDFGVRLWDGSVWGEAKNPVFTIVLNHRDALGNMLADASELSLGEAFIAGDFEIEGDMEKAFTLGDHLLSKELSLAEKLWLRTKLPLGSNRRDSQNRQPRLVGEKHSKDRDRYAVTFHYDVSNEFYNLWLDSSMVYSCAYFRTPYDTLETAQYQKLDLICRKLRLERGDRMLDIGCGWGGLLMHAARRYGVHAFGVTLSVPQAELARQNIHLAGLSDRCKVEVCDYRELDPPQPFDKIVSVGMFEHVGEHMLSEYFRRAFALLRPGGTFLNHGIAASATLSRSGPSFIDKYVFPDGELVPIHCTLGAAESCSFEVRDVESLREHYALTLQHWVTRLLDHSAAATEIVGEPTYRVWRLYLAGSAHGFNTGRLNLYQVLLSKPDHGRTYLPLTREDWYGHERRIVLAEA
jgi:cyclopropane-fatty-acyl-phospholipid synthase